MRHNWPWEIPAALVLLPIVAAQGTATRRRAVSLDEPAGARQGENGADGPRIRVLILGDSSAAGVGVAVQHDALSGRLAHHLGAHARVQWRLIAKCGATSRDVTGWLGEVTPEPVDWVLIGLGLNDVTRGVPLRRWLARQRAIADRLRRDWGNPRIIFTGLPPVRRFPLLPQPLRWLVGLRAERFDRHRIEMVNDDPQLFNLPFEGDLDPEMMAEDRYHPGAQIYDRWAELTADLIWNQLQVQGPSSRPTSSTQKDEPGTSAASLKS